jgi:hypothetical protein
MRYDQHQRMTGRMVNTLFVRHDGREGRKYGYRRASTRLIQCVSLSLCPWFVFYNAHGAHCKSRRLEVGVNVKCGEGGLQG